MDFEQDLERGLYRGHQERTFIDKVLAKDDVNALRELIKKPELTRSELLEILYLIGGTESKLLNYSDWDRYVILKFFVWIREFIKICEILYDYEDELKKKEENKKLKITERTKRLLNNNKMLLQHNAKFLVDLYLNIARTSMSISGTGFLEVLKNKHEVIYPNLPVTTQVEEKKGFLGLGGR